MSIKERIRNAFIAGSAVFALSMMVFSDIKGKEGYAQYVLEHWIEWDSFWSLVVYFFGIAIIIYFLAIEYIERQKAKLEKEFTRYISGITNARYGDRKPTPGSNIKNYH